MAKHNKEHKDTIVDVEEVYSKTEQYVEENRKPILIIVGIIVLIFIGYFSYTRLYLAPRNQEASQLLWKAQYYMQIDSLDKAINGDDTYFGFDYIARQYGSTKAGNLARYYLGTIYMKKGQYQDAIDNLKKADLDDELVAAMDKGLLGDAYVQLGDYDKALTAYKEAIDHSDNELTAPMYLKKAALIYEKEGKKDQALANYKLIKDKYPKSSEATDIDFYIGRIGG